MSEKNCLFCGKDLKKFWCSKFCGSECESLHSKELDIQNAARLEERVSKRKASKKVYSKIRRDKIFNERESLISLAGGGCQVCGYNKCSSALHFHHRDPSTKLFTLSKSSLSQRSAEDIKNEFEKCVLLCANCHAEVHFEERRSPL